MKTFEKVINVMARNLFYTIILAIAYVCIELLYKDYHRTVDAKPASKPAKRTKSQKKPASRKK